MNEGKSLINLNWSSEKDITSKSATVKGSGGGSTSPGDGGGCCSGGCCCCCSSPPKYNIITKWLCK